MQSLERIGMNRNWIYEVIVTTYCDAKPHSAPIGIWTDDFATLQMEIYKETKTIGNILKVREFAVNLVSDLTIFYEALFDKARITYGESIKVNAPVIKNAPSIIELKVKDIVEKDRTFKLKSTPVHISAQGSVNLINRAKALALESLVLATKAPHLPESTVRDTLRENRRVVEKVAPGSEYESILGMLFDRLKISSGSHNSG